MLVLPVEERSHHPSLRGALGDSFPIVPVPSWLYWAYNVRVVPFVTVIDRDGVIRMNGIVNYKETLMKLWREARAVRPPKKRR